MLGHLEVSEAFDFGGIDHIFAKKDAFGIFSVVPDPSEGFSPCFVVDHDFDSEAEGVEEKSVEFMDKSEFPQFFYIGFLDFVCHGFHLLSLGMILLQIAFGVKLFPAWKSDFF